MAQECFKCHQLFTTKEYVCSTCTVAVYCSKTCKQAYRKAHKPKKCSRNKIIDPELKPGAQVLNVHETKLFKCKQSQSLFASTDAIQEAFEARIKTIHEGLNAKAQLRWNTLQKVTESEITPFFGPSMIDEKGGLMTILSPCEKKYICALINRGCIAEHVYQKVDANMTSWLMAQRQNIMPPFIINHDTMKRAKYQSSYYHVLLQQMLK